MDSDFKKVAFDLEAGGLAFDFKTGPMTATKQGTAMSQMSMYERMMQSTAAAVRPRHEGKMASIAAAYGMGPKLMDDIKFRRGDKFRRDHEAAAAMNCERAEDWRWAVAFRTVLGVGPEFYENAGGMRKRHLEAHYTELSGHPSSKGRKAARVVAHRVQMALEERKPFGGASDDMLDALRYTLSSSTQLGTMRSSSPQIQNLPRDAKLRGNQIHSIIIDEATELRGLDDTHKQRPGALLADSRRPNPGHLLDGHDAPDQLGQPADPEEQPERTPMRQADGGTEDGG